MLFGGCFEKVFVDDFFQVFFGLKSENGVDLVAVVGYEYQHWNRLCAECHGCHWVIVDIDLLECDAAGVLPGQLFDNWSQTAARAAPRRPEVDNGR